MTVCTKVCTIVRRNPDEFNEAVKSMLTEQPGATVHYSASMGAMGLVFTALLVWEV